MASIDSNVRKYPVDVMISLIKYASEALLSLSVRHRCLLSTVKLYRLIVVCSSMDVDEEMRHVYSPASSSDASDKINDHVHA